MTATNPSVVLERMTQISLVGDPDVAFRRIRETLTRIGVPEYKDGEPNVLYQTCHILHKRGSYFLTHFKNMLALDGKFDRVNQVDLERQNVVAKLLQDWGMITVVNKDVDFESLNTKKVKVIKHEDLPNWSLQSKYDIGAVVKQPKSE